MSKLNMVKALNLALQQEMERDPDVLVLGEIRLDPAPPAAPPAPRKK